MTRDEILSMEPGRELDALVAEKVMEFEYFIDAEGRVVTKRGIFQPSTNIAAAWEVVEKMQKQGYVFSLAQQAINDWYVCRFTKREIFSGLSSTAPEAICKAALLAVEGGEGE